MSNVHLIDHPLLQHSLTLLREEYTSTAEFKSHSAIVSKILLMEATRDLLLSDKSITTPLAPMNGKEIADSLLLVPVLRAGLSMLFTAQEFLPGASAGFIGLERDEKTAIAHEYYQKFPDGLSEKQVIILDPMLATGGSLLDTLSALENKGAKKMRMVCIVAAPEGIETIQEKYPDICIYTGAIDDHLNDMKYIVPGLGDFGDRYFGT